MSFKDLRSSRQSKESKSFVNINMSSQTHNTTLAEKSTTSTVAEGSDLEKSRDLQALQGGDGLYKNLPDSMYIQPSRLAGRGVWMKNKVFPGDSLLCVRPQVAVLSNQYLDSFCSFCCGPSSTLGLKRCTGCRTTWYCDSACQNRDWANHKLECAALQKWAASAPSAELGVPTEAVRCLGRIMWKKKKQGEGSVWAREFESMQSHRTSLPPSATEMHTHLAHSLVRYLGLSSPAEMAEYGISSARDLVDIISRFITNTFTLTSPSLTPLGITVSPLVALINHSCDPNAVVVFPRGHGGDPSHEPVMHIIALREISEGDEILTSYIDTTLPHPIRQRSLQETYNFECQCRLCTINSNIDPRESMWCPKACGGTCPVPTEENSFTRCSRCKTVVSSTDTVLDALRVGQEGLDKANSVQSRDPAKAIQLTTNLIPILTSAGLVPSSHPLLALGRLHQNLLISSLQSNMTQDYLDETIRTSAKASGGLADVLSPGHPVRAVAVAELGKLLAVDEPEPSTDRLPSAATPTFPPSGPPRLKLAYDTLVRARNELHIGFGKANEGGQVSKEIRDIIVSLEKEIGVWSQGVRNVVNDTYQPQINRA